MSKKKPVVRYRIFFSDKDGQKVHETVIRAVSVAALKRMVASDKVAVLGATMQAATPLGGWYEPIAINQNLWLEESQ